MEKMPHDYLFEIWEWRWYILAAIAVIASTPIIYALIRDRRQKRELTATRKRNFERWAALVREHQQLPVVETNLMLGGGEVVHHTAPAVLVEPRAVRVSSHGGAAYHAGGGIILGGGRSVSESHDEWRRISEGRVYVTSSRVIFAGDKANRAVGIDSIMAVDADADSVVISADSRQKPMVLADTNGLIVRAAIQILCHQD